MATLGRILFGIQVAFLLLAAILIGASFGGFINSGLAMKIAAIAVILLWGSFAALTINAVRLAVGLTGEAGDLLKALQWANASFLIVMLLSPFTGLGLAFLSFVGCGKLWLPDIYMWVGLAGTILGFPSFILLPVLVRVCIDDTVFFTILDLLAFMPSFFLDSLQKIKNFATPHRWWCISLGALALVVAWCGPWLVVYSILKGDISLSDYPATNRVYALPFPGGESSWVIQGNNSSFDHNNDSGHFLQKFSWDFRRECGTPVLASRDGTIDSLTVDTFDAFGTSSPNNQVAVDQSDHAVAFYLHIQKGSLPTRFRTTGAKVNKGDQIAEVGCVGRSLTGHIHFMVRSSATGNPTIGVSFTDVSDDNGIPRTFGTYTSGNRKVP